MVKEEHIRKIYFRVSNVKPCSINKAYFKTRRVMTVDGRRYRKRLLCTMSKIEGLKEVVRSFSKSFDPVRHVITLETTYHIPQQLCITKKGYLSRKGGDVDNYSKLTTDFLTTSKYNGYVFTGYEDLDIFNIDIDDQFIVDHNNSKRVSVDGLWHIDVVVKMYDISDFFEESLLQEDLPLSGTYSE